MRIGVISDTHISGSKEEIPQAVLNDFKNCDIIIHAGDIGGIEVLNALENSCKKVRAVWGNMDPPEIKQKLPEKQIIAVDGFKIGVIHGYGRPDKLVDLVNETFKKDKVDLIVFGHSHIALNEKKGSTIFFNPGSPTDKIFAPYNSYGIIEINDTIEAKIIKL